MIQANLSNGEAKELKTTGYRNEECNVDNRCLEDSTG